MEHTSFLRHMHNFFDALPPPVKAEFEAVSRYRDVVVGEIFRHVGTRPGEVFQIVAGRVRYFASDREGRESVLTFMGKGDWIGLSELFSGMAAAWNVAALSSVRLRVIARADFERILSRHPVIAIELLRIFSIRFSLFNVFGLDHSHLTLKERVVKMLYVTSFSLADGDAANEDIVLRLSQEELSRLVGSSRQKLNVALKLLEQDGLVKVGFGALTQCGRARVLDRYGYLFNSQALAVV